MAQWQSFLYLLPKIWHVLVHLRETVDYPFGPLELPPGFRGRVVINAEKCRGCGVCVRDCPAAALELERVSRDEFRLIYHPDRCAYCSQCELSCAFDAMYLSNDFVRGSPQRETFTITLVDRANAEES